MHVKLATLRVMLALGVQICNWEAMEWTEIDRMKMMKVDSASRVETLTSSGCESSQCVKAVTQWVGQKQD